MKSAVVAFLLAFGVPGLPPGADDHSPSALVVAPDHPRLSAATLLGAWRGTQVARGATARSPLEVAFADGVRPATIFAYFVFGDGDTASRLRRLGSLTRDQVTFSLADGRQITLRLAEDDRRLLGRLAERDRSSAIELWRVRDHASHDPGGRR